jgi:hypothetical protein
MRVTSICAAFWDYRKTFLWVIRKSGCISRSMQMFQMKGYKEIRVYFKIDADVSDEQKKELIQMAQKYSPVFNTITKSAPVSVRLDK